MSKKLDSSTADLNSHRVVLILSILVSAQLGVKVLRLFEYTRPVQMTGQMTPG